MLTIKRKIIISGSIPSKKNSRRPYVRNGRIMNFPSKRFKEWHSKAMKELGLCKSPKIQETAKISVVLWQIDKRKRDLSNQFESVADLLVDTGYLKDDNCFVLTDITIKMGGVDRLNPRAEVELESNQ